MGLFLGDNEINKLHLGNEVVNKLYLGSDLVFDNETPPILVNNIIFDGDSLTEGVTNSGMDQYYPKEVIKEIETLFDVTYESFGISGQWLETMLANAPTKIYPLAVLVVKIIF